MYRVSRLLFYDTYRGQNFEYRASLLSIRQYIFYAIFKPRPFAQDLFGLACNDEHVIIIIIIISLLHKSLEKTVIRM